MDESKEKWTKVCYVAGPYRAANIHLQIKHIRAAEEIGKELWFYGFVPIIPHKNAELMEGAYGLGHKEFLKGDLAILDLCSFVVVIPGWQYSEGTLEEIKRAQNNGQPIFYWEKFLDREHLRNFYKENK